MHNALIILQILLMCSWQQHDENQEDDENATVLLEEYITLTDVSAVKTPYSWCEVRERTRRDDLYKEGVT